MPFIVVDFECPKCGAKHPNVLFDEKKDKWPRCKECRKKLMRKMPAPKELTTIVPTYPGSKQYKAGHVHKFKNRPATKTQIGYGGSVSADHPTGGGGKGQES